MWSNTVQRKTHPLQGLYFPFDFQLHISINDVNVSRQSVFSRMWMNVKDDLETFVFFVENRRWLFPYRLWATEKCHFNWRKISIFSQSHLKNLYKWLTSTNVHKITNSPFHKCLIQFLNTETPDNSSPRQNIIKLILICALCFQVNLLLIFYFYFFSQKNTQ